MCDIRPNGSPLLSGWSVAVAAILFTLLLPVNSCSALSGQQKATMEQKWDEDAFTVETISLADNPTAIWIITKEGTPGSPVDLTSPYDKAEGVLEVFGRQPPRRKDRGIFIYSKTYAIPNTPEEKQWMTEHLWQLYNNPEWRKSEAALIEDLRVECEKRKIPLHVNLSANLQGKWKQLAPAKVSKTDN